MHHGHAQSIHVSQIEPPNWWAGMRTRQLELLLYGEFPRQTTVTSTHADLQVRGTYVPKPKPRHRTTGHLFVSLQLSRNIRPGSYDLILSAGGGQKVVSFPIQPRVAGERRHQGFHPGDVIYLITPDRFANGDRSNDSADGVVDEYAPSQPQMRHGGDLRGIQDRLPYLRELGITALWLNPVLENRGVNSYHGYKATNLYRIDPRLGTNQTYRNFVRAAHEQGLKVIFDHVSNHVGVRHPWVNDPPDAGWFHGNLEEHLLEKHFLLAPSDPHATPRAVEQLKSFWFVDSMPDLDQRNPRLARYLIQNTLWWVEFAGIDGIREDTYPYADQGYLADWAKQLRAEYPQLNIVGEIWATKPASIARYQQQTILPRDVETHLPAVMDFPLMTAFRNFLSGNGKLRDVYETLTQDFLYTDTDNLLIFMDNHDTPRALFAADGDERRVRLILTILMTTRGIPQLLYGTELGMLGGESHVELRADFPGGFPGDTGDGTSAEGRTAKQNATYQFTKQLLKIRSSHPALTGGSLIHCAPTWRDDTYKFVRVTDEETILVVANGHLEPKNTSLRELSRYLGQGRLLDLMSEERVDAPNLTIELAPLEAKVFQVLHEPAP